MAGALLPGGGARSSTDPFREWDALHWWDGVDYETESCRPTVTTRTVPLEQRTMVGCAKARSLVVLDRATRAFRDLERHAAHLRGQGLAAPNELTVALAAARLHEERAWKVVSFADRLLFATSPRGGKGNKSFGDVLKSRLGWFERGDWAQLYRDVDRCRRSGGSRGQKQARQRGSQSLRGRARRVTALLREGEWGKATSAVMAKDPPRKDRGALRELRALFPSAATEAGGKRGAAAAGLGEPASTVFVRDLRRNASDPGPAAGNAAPGRPLRRHGSAPGLPPAPGGPAERLRVEVDESSEAFQRLVGGIAKYLPSAPNRAAPGPLGSRFEHWKFLSVSPLGHEAAARVLARLLLGGAPVEVVDAHVGATLYALPKASGGVRPIACGSVLRRLAAGGFARAYKEELCTAAGPHQFAVGRAGGAEIMQKAVAVAAEHRPGAVTVKYDVKNAYNSLTREAARDGLAQGARTVLASHAVTLPDVAPTLASGVTTHWWVDAVGEACPVRAERGVDQGCPLSPALFALAVAPALARVAAALRELDPGALVFAYLDDVVIHVDAQHAGTASALLAAEFGPLGLTLHADKTAVWSPNAAVRQDLPASLRDRWAFHLPVLGSAIPFVRASYPDAEESDPSAEASATERAVVALNDFQAALLELRSAGLKSTDAQSLHRIYVNGAVTHLLRGSLQDVGWCDLWDSHVEQFWEKLLYTELTAAQRVHVHLPLSSEYTGRGVQSARWRREAAFLGSWHLCLGSVAVALRFVSAGQLLQAAQRSVRVPLAEAASVIRTLVPGYSFDADALFEEPDAKRQSELMEAVYAAKEATLVDALWNKNPRGDAVAAARSSGGPHAADYLLPPTPAAAAAGTKALGLTEDEGVIAMRADLQVPYPAYLPRFQRERGPAQQCNHQYSQGSTICGHSLTQAGGAPDVDGKHAQQCNVGGLVDARHNGLRDWLKSWLRSVCHYTSAETEQHVKEWDRWVQAKDANGRLKFTTVNTPEGPQRVPEMTVWAAVLDVSFTDDEGGLVFVDVSYTNACTPDADKTLRNARTAGKAASVRADEKRKRYPPQDHPHAELVPFVVEARGRLGEEVLPFLRHHAPAEEPLRSAVLARALRDISIITKQGLAALLLAAEPRPASV